MSYAAVRLLLDDEQQMLSVMDFIQMFSKQYNDVIDEHLITTMKHAIEVNLLFTIYEWMRPKVRLEFEVF